MNHKDVLYFVHESNKIENIFHVKDHEVNEFIRFMALDKISIEELQRFVKVYQPDAVLRDQWGLDVRIGNYFPPAGGPEICIELQSLLDSDLDAYDLHVAYELLHPFTDCNGRSGRALWAWKHRDISLGFLHMFYYQTLANSQ